MSSRINSSLLGQELEFTASRSSGPGGQNVNKVNSKITLRWNVLSSAVVTEEERETILTKLKARISAEGVFILISQQKRSQLQNKEEAVHKLDELLKKAFTKKKLRKSTKPTRNSLQQRLNKKKKRAEKKQWRQKMNMD
jgi:ribosome-associated protein